MDDKVKRNGGQPENPRRTTYRAAFGLEGHLARFLPLDLLDTLDACLDDSARRLMLGLGEPFTDEDTALEFRKFSAAGGRATADWLEEFSRHDAEWIGRNGRVRWRSPAKKTVAHVPMVDYRNYRHDPRIWRMMRLSKVVNG